MFRLRLSMTGERPSPPVRHSELPHSAWARRSLGKKHQLNHEDHEGHEEFEQTLILFVLFVCFVV
jgi:hypothetical protein